METLQFILCTDHTISKSLDTSHQATKLQTLEIAPRLEQIKFRINLHIPRQIAIHQASNTYIPDYILCNNLKAVNNNNIDKIISKNSKHNE